MSSGGGQSGETRYNWNDTIGNYWGGNADYPGGTLLRGLIESNKPYEQYGGQRVAGISADQWDAMNSIRHTASGQGAPDTAAGRNAAMLFAQGPGGYNQNPWAEAAVSAENNEYGGMNSPEFLNMLGVGTRRIRDEFAKGTEAETRRMFNLSGAFGGSAHQQATQDNQEALGRSLSDYIDQASQQQYDRSAGLREADISRDLQAQQFDKNIGFTGYENALQRQLNAIPLAFQGQGLAFDAARQLMGIGDFHRGIEQQTLDNQYNDWTQAQNWDRNQIGWLAQLLTQAQGSTGVTQQLGGYQGINPGAGLLGAAAIGRGMQWY